MISPCPYVLMLHTIGATALGFPTPTFMALTATSSGNLVKTSSIDISADGTTVVGQVNGVHGGSWKVGTPTYPIPNFSDETSAARACSADGSIVVGFQRYDPGATPNYTFAFRVTPPPLVQP